MTDRARRLAKLSPAKRELLERQLERRRREGDRLRRRPIPARGETEGLHPLSFSQERFWFLQQLEPSSIEYNVVGSGRFAGSFHREAMERALTDVVQRHAILRTTFPDVDGVPQQRVARHGRVALPCVDLSKHGADREAAAVEEARRFCHEPFDLARGPLLRALLLRLAPDDHVLLILHHHIVCDGWSLAVLGREMAALYNAHVRRAPASLRRPALQFPDYARWERERMTGEHLERELRFWSERLAGAPPALELPFDRPRPPLQTHAGRTVVFGLGPTLSDGVRQLAAEHGTTLFVTLLAAFDAFLARISGETDVVVGTSIANRDRPEVEGLLGPLVNTLALRVDCGGSPSFSELLARTRRVAAEAFAHPDLPFERLVDELSPDRDPGRPPVFNVFFDMAVPLGDADYVGLEVRPFAFDHERAMFDLALSVADGEDEVTGAVEFNTDLFDRSTIERLWRSFTVLLEGVVADPSRPVDALPLLDDAERRRILHDFNTTALPVDEDAFVHRRFEQCVHERPDAPALEEDGRPVTYGVLERRANRLAHHLIGRGVGADVRVAVRLPRSVDVPVVILAIWKAGGVYVPIDPSDPHERQRLLLSEAHAAVLVTRDDVAPMDAPAGVDVVRLDRPLAEDEPDSPPDRPMAPDDLAYVIFTSGSTGRPKGVAIPQSALLNHVAWVRDAFDIAPSDRFLLRTPLTFDASLWEIVHPLVSGACLVVAPPAVQRDPARLLELVGQSDITVLQTVPSMLASWLEEPRLSACRSLRHLICAGEPLRLELVHAFDRLCRDAGLPTTLHNLYGPSEACIDASAHTCRRGPDGLTTNRGRDTLPVGRPVSNFRIHILDGARQPVPVGVTGELFVGGAGLARGYLDRPDLTAEGFVDDPFGPGRLYRTGDLARYLPDGEIEYVGRRDGQVKVRGHRIELGEVEVAVASHPAVREAAVVTDGDGGAARLVAYFVCRADATVDDRELRAHLGERLPRHMIPSVFVRLDALPLTASEKVDRRALPPPPSDRTDARAPSVAPRTATESRLAELVAELLQLDRVGVFDDFFALGGHSLLATRLAARVRAAWSVDVPLLRFFETPTVADLALAVDEASVVDSTATGDADDAPADITASTVPLSFAQQRLWFLWRLDPDATHFNMPGGVRLRGRLDAAALGRAFDDLVRRHEVLRTVIRERAGEPRGAVVETPEGALGHEDISALSPAAQRDRIDERLRAEADHVFDLSRGPLLRASLLRVADEEHVLVFNQHHIASDAWSLAVVASELSALYSAHARGAVAELPALPWQYADFARWQREHLSGPRLAELLDYWRETLRGAPPSLELPVDRPRPERPRHAGATLHRQLPSALARDARRLARDRETTPYVVLLAAFDALLHRVTRTEDVVVATAVAHRTRLETEPLVGLFINTVPIRVDVSGRPTFTELLRRAQRAAHGAFAHQDLPFERMVDELTEQRDPRRPPLVNVSFNLLTTDEPAWALADVDVEAVPFDAGRSKLDLGVTLIEADDGLDAELEYDVDLFDGVTIERLWDVYVEVVAACLADPERPVATLPLLSDASRQRVLESSRGPALGSWETAPVDGLVARFAEATPDAEALVGGDERLDYRELDQRVARCADQLRRLGVGRDELVGVCLRRSVALVVALLAAWRVGGAWVVVSPDDPPGRRRRLLRSTGARVVLTEAEGMEELSDDDVRPVTMDDAGAAPSRDQASSAAQPPAGAGDLAYVMFTSGSTGEPKAVEMSHAALSHHTAWFARHLGFTAADRLLQKIPVTFDAALLEILTPLAVGGTLVLADEDVADDPARLLELGARERATVLNAVPSLMSTLVDHERLAQWRDLRVAFCGGERLPAELVRRFAARCERLGLDVPLHNLYGPTEACIDATAYRCPPDVVDAVPIGRPIADARAYVVDETLAVVPELVPGELLVAGAGLAQGYRNLPEATAAAFVDDPAEPGARAYRTGDLVRRRADGELVYLGRIDDQIKVRGQRLEPGEVEAALTDHPGVREVCVTCADGAVLVAHVAGRHLDADELRAFAAERLPPAFVPTIWSLVDALPRTPHGKVDRRALEATRLERDPPSGPSETAPAPRTPLEGQLLAIVRDLLGRDDVAVHDDFFARGGHSLLAIQLVARVAETVGVELPLREVFAGPTAAQMAVVAGMLQRGESLGRLEDRRVVDLVAEAVLDDDIRPAAPRLEDDRRPAATTPPPTSPVDSPPPGRRLTPSPQGRDAPARAVVAPRHILLTGGTGFLGAFLLRELLDRTDARVRCLVRASDDDAARRRLVDNLERYELWDERLAAAIVPVAGDLGRPRLGLTERTFDELSAEIDVVYHSGAAVNFFHDYGHLKAANVDGTRELLRLACAHRPTPLHFVSTIGVLASPAASRLPEISEDVALDGFADVDGGYEQSKWVAEQLVRSAGRRGLPVAVYRPGRIAGHSTTGVGNVDDVGGRILRGCLELGSAPDVDAPVDITPVDYVAAAIAHLSLRARPAGEAYHLVNPTRTPMSDIFDWAREEGYDVRMVRWEAWLEELSRTVARQPQSTLYPLLPLFATEGADESDFAPDVRLPPLGCRNALNGLRGSTIRCPTVDRVMLSRWLRFFARRGLLATPDDAHGDRRCPSPST